MTRSCYATTRNALAAAASLLILAGCNPTSDTATTAAATTTTRADTNPVGAAGGGGHGWTSGGIDGPIPAPGHCHLHTAADGEPLPDPACTPGAADPAVTPASLPTTVCRPGGYTATVRPPERIAAAAKKQLMAAYAIPYSHAHDYELDHLLPESAGGSSAAANLWPQSPGFRPAGYSFNPKDKVEHALNHAVCTGQVSLSAAQTAIATNWTTALSVLHARSTP